LHRSGFLAPGLGAHPNHHLDTKTALKGGRLRFSRSGSHTQAFVRAPLLKSSDRPSAFRMVPLRSEDPPRPGSITVPATLGSPDQTARAQMVPGTKPLYTGPVCISAEKLPESVRPMRPSDTAPGECVTFAPAEKSGRLWSATIALMCLCAITMAWFPLLDIGALPSNNYNEGWNAYREWMTVEGLPLYGSRPTLWTTNYPFLSFHIVGFLGAAKEDMVLAGRIICFVSLVASSALVGGIVLLITGSRAGALYAGFCLFASFGSFYDAGRASNEPELLSVAFTVLGLLAYLKNPRRPVWVALSAIAFAVSLFTKHDLIAFPLSIGIHLLITRNWRGVAIFLATGISVSVVLLALTFHLDGPYFLAELLQPRAYDYDNLRYETLHYLLHFLVMLVIGAVLLLRDRSTPYRSFFLVLLAVTNLIAAYFSGGDGVAANVFYPPLIADLLVFVIMICRLEDRSGKEPQAARSFRAALVVSTLVTAIMVPFRLHHDIVAQLRLPATTVAARQAIADLESAHGPAICEDLLLCYESGKAMDFDPYYVQDQILIGRLQEGSILAMLTAHHYAAVQIDGAVDATSLAERRDKRFSKPFLRTLLAEYRPVLVTPAYSVFVPRG
jgi:hypothetical protein